MDTKTITLLVLEAVELEFLVKDQTELVEQMDQLVVEDLVVMLVPLVVEDLVVLVVAPVVVAVIPPRTTDTFIQLYEPRQ